MRLHLQAPIQSNADALQRSKSHYQPRPSSMWSIISVGEGKSVAINKPPPAAASTVQIVHNRSSRWRSFVAIPPPLPPCPALVINAQKAARAIDQYIPAITIIRPPEYPRHKSRYIVLRLRRGNDVSSLRVYRSETLSS